MEPLFAFQIVVDWPRPPGLHIHDCHLELFACIDGRGHQYLGDQVFAAQAGELYLLPAGQRHLSSGIGKGLHGLVLNATLEAVPGGGHELLAVVAALHAHVRRAGPLLPLSPTGFSRVVAAMQRVADEARERRPGHLAAAMLAYGETLLAIRRDPHADEMPFRTHSPAVAERIRHLCGWLVEAFRGGVTIERMAEVSGLSRTALHEHFHTVTGLTPRAYVERLRLDEAERLLRETDTPITDIALTCGFGSLSRFYAAFQRRTGMAPQRWRNRRPS